MILIELDIEYNEESYYRFLSLKLREINRWNI